MSAETLNRQLAKLGLAGPNDEQSIGAMQADRWVVFGDADGETMLITDVDDAGRQLRQVIQGGFGLTREGFGPAHGWTMPRISRGSMSFGPVYRQYRVTLP